MIEITETLFGFIFGAAEVVRVCSDEKQGWVYFDVKTNKQTLNVYVTKTGKIRVYKNRLELK